VFLQVVTFFSTDYSGLRRPQYRRADTSPAIKIIGLAIKPFVVHETTALCAFHGWSPPLRRLLPAKSFLSQNNKHFFRKSNLFGMGKGKFPKKVLES
jgi:hypothetical protein